MDIDLYKFLKEDKDRQINFVLPNKSQLSLHYYEKGYWELLITNSGNKLVEGIYGTLEKMLEYVIKYTKEIDDIWNK